MASAALEYWSVPAALALEACVGYPKAVYARIAHPVVWVGRLIEQLERRWNDATRTDAARRALGILAIAIITGLAGFVGHVVQSIAVTPLGAAAVVLIATSGLAQRSLYTHVNDVLQPLLAGDLQGSRIALSRIVGRDTDELDESGIAAAALESLAESFNDGVVSPAFWCFIGGLPGLFIYKAINTADSLVGHREPRWRMFGWAAARVDDVANLVPARLAGLLIVLAGLGGFRVMCRYAGRHASPNAGWPEAAMAGALRAQLGGTARYEDIAHDRPFLGVGMRPGPHELVAGLHIYMCACALLWLTATAMGMFLTLRS